LHDVDPWHVKRKRELEAAAPSKRKKTVRFARVPLKWAARAATATKTPKALVWVRLLYLAWEQNSQTFDLPSKWLEQHGVNRFAKNRALKELAAAGLITVERRARKSPLVILL
jgi:hypothetical protein